MPPSNTFIPNLEATLKAEYLAAGAAGRPMFGSASVCRCECGPPSGP